MIYPCLFKIFNNKSIILKSTVWHVIIQAILNQTLLKHARIQMLYVVYYVISFREWWYGLKIPMWFSGKLDHTLKN